MLCLNAGIKRGLLIVFFCGLCQLVLGQHYSDLAFRIDSLGSVGLPKSALAEVGRLEQLARQNNDAGQLVKVALYRVRFQRYMQEDALTAVIKQLRADIQKAAFPAKPVLQSLLAEMYWQYYLDKRWEISKRSRLASPGPDFTHWDTQTLIEYTGGLYQSSLQNWRQAQQTPVNVVEAALVGDQRNRYLRPTLYDLLGRYRAGGCPV